MCDDGDPDNPVLRDQAPFLLKISSSNPQTYILSRLIRCYQTHFTNIKTIIDIYTNKLKLNIILFMNDFLEYFGLNWPNNKNLY